MINNSTLIDVQMLLAEGLSERDVADQLKITRQEVRKLRVARPLPKSSSTAGDGHLEDCNLRLSGTELERYTQIRDYYAQIGLMCSSPKKGQGGFDTCRALSSV